MLSRSKPLTAASLAFVLAIFSPAVSRAQDAITEEGRANPEPPAASAPVALPALTPPPPAKDEPQEKEEEPEHVGIGAMGGVGFPRPLSVEALVRIERTVAIGVEYSALPKITISGVDAQMWAIAGDARVFPFRGAFFLGVRGGVQHAKGATTLTIAQLGSYAEELDMTTVFVNPRLGFLWGSAPGLTVGIEAGVQIPLSSQISSNLPSQILASSQLTSVTNTFGKNALPTVDLLRIGFLF